MTSTDGQAIIPAAGFHDDVVEIKECRASEANQLLGEGWRLQGVYSFSQRAEGRKPGESSYIRRGVMYVMLRRAQGQAAQQEVPD